MLILLKAGDVVDFVVGMGDPRLALLNDRKIIVRRSTHIDDATIAIRSCKSARDLDRGLVEELRRGANLEVTIVGIVP